MKRQIIRIDEELCNGCGQCITGCPEGALQIIDGKARLVSDLFCDGLGACIGTCPQGAIIVEEREAEPYDERRVMVGIAAKGTSVIAAHLQHLREHGENGYLREALEYLQEQGVPVPVAAVHHGGGCPGSRERTIAPRPAARQAGPLEETGSELRQWPVQLALVNPASPSFDDADLLVVADCVPFAYGDFHRHFLAGRSLVMFCPKLDARIDEYVEKLAEVFSRHRVRSVTALRMEVPCCGGVRMVVQKALEKSGVSVPMREYIIAIDGGIVGERALSEACAF